MKSIAAVVQARINSSRFPKKILRPLYQELNSIDLIFLRLQKSDYINKIIFAVPEKDYELIDYIEQKNYSYSIGDEQDVTSRYLKAAAKNKIKTIVRITSDCPLIDPKIVDKCVKLSSEFDYVSNNTPPEESDYANGSDVEVFSFSLLELASKKFISLRDKEHVTFPFWDGRMNIHAHRLKKDISDKSIRITLDYKDDLEVIKMILDKTKNIHIGYDDIILTYKKLNLNKINGQYHYNSGWGNKDLLVIGGSGKIGRFCIEKWLQENEINKVWNFDLNKLILNNVVNIEKNILIEDGYEELKNIISKKNLVNLLFLQVTIFQDLKML